MNHTPIKIKSGACVSVSRVSSWGNEVETDVDTSVVEVDQVSLDLQLFGEVLLKLLVQVGDDGIGRVLLVDLITIPSSADHRQPQVDVTLLQSWIEGGGREGRNVFSRENKRLTTFFRKHTQ